MVRFLVAGLLTLMMLGGACGGDDSSDGAADADSSGESGSVGAGSDESGGDFDESQLPADFPTEIIPANYDFASYAELGSTLTAAFETTDAAASMVDRYSDLLGEPDSLVDDDGGVLAQWTSGDWVISLVGDSSESIIGATKITG